MGLIGVSTAERFRTASVQDPSIDWAKSSVTADDYRMQHGLEGLSVKDGEQLTVFVFRALTMDERTAILDDFPDRVTDRGIDLRHARRALAAYRLAILTIEDPEIAGGRHKLEWVDEGGQKLLAPSSVRQVPPDVVTEIGSKILRSSELSETELGNSSPQSSKAT